MWTASRGERSRANGAVPFLEFACRVGMAPRGGHSESCMALRKQGLETRPSLAAGALVVGLLTPAVVSAALLANQAVCAKRGAQRRSLCRV